MATVYTVNNNRLAVPQHIHNAFQGKALRHSESLRIDIYHIGRTEKQGRVNRNFVNHQRPPRKSGNHTLSRGPSRTTEAGRPSNSTFPFDQKHPLATSHVQRKRSKTKVPISVGRMPRPPVSKPSNPTATWKR